jgi:hypothetical protein
LLQAEEALRTRDYEVAQSQVEQFDRTWLHIDGDFDFAIARPSIETRLRDELHIWNSLCATAAAQLVKQDDHRAARTIERLATLRPSHALVKELQVKLLQVRESRNRQRRVHRKVALIGGVAFFVIWSVLGIVQPSLALSAMHASQARELMNAAEAMQAAELVAAGVDLRALEPTIKRDLRTETLQAETPRWLPARSTALFLCDHLVAAPEHADQFANLEGTRSGLLTRLANGTSEVRQVLQRREVSRAKELAEELTRICRDCLDVRDLRTKVDEVASVYELRSQLEGKMAEALKSSELLKTDEMVQQWRRAGAANQDWTPPELLAAELAWMTTDSEQLQRVATQRVRLGELEGLLSVALSACDIPASVGYLREYRAIQRHGRLDLEQQLERRQVDDQVLSPKLNDIESLLQQLKYTDAKGALEQQDWRGHFRATQLQTQVDDALAKIEGLAFRHQEFVRLGEVRSARSTSEELVRFAPYEARTQECAKTQETLERSRLKLVELDLAVLFEVDILTDEDLIPRAKRLHGLLLDSKDRLGEYGGPQLDSSSFLKELERLLRIQAFASDGQLPAAELLATKELSPDKYFDPVRRSLQARRTQCSKLLSEWLGSIKKGTRAEITRASANLADLQKLDAVLVEGRDLVAWQGKVEAILQHLENGRLRDAKAELDAEASKAWGDVEWKSAYRAQVARQAEEAAASVESLRKRKGELGNLTLEDLANRIKALRVADASLAAEVESEGLFGELRTRIEQENERKKLALRELENQRRTQREEVTSLCSALLRSFDGYSDRFLAVVSGLVEEQRTAIRALETEWLAAIQRDEKKSQETHRAAVKRLEQRLAVMAEHWPRLDVTHGVVESARVSCTIRFTDPIVSAANGMSAGLVDRIRRHAKGAVVGAPLGSDALREDIETVTAPLRRALRYYIEAAQGESERPNVARALDRLAALGEDSERIQELRAEAVQAVGHWPVVVAAGGDHSLGLWTDGSIRGAGSNDFGQGLSYTKLDSKSKDGGGGSAEGTSKQSGILSLLSTAVTAIVGVVSTGVSVILSGDWLPTMEGSAVRLAAGSKHSAVVLDSGDLKVWGDNSSGQIKLSHTEDVASVALGERSTIVLYEDGFVRAFGANSKDVPTSLTKPDANIIAIASGGDFGLALLNNGKVEAWGNASIVSGLPLVPSGKRCVQLAAGMSHAAMLLSDGSILFWGDSAQRQGNVAVPKKGTRYIQVAAGGSCTLAVSSEGQLFAWGETLYGQTNIPIIPAGDSVVSVSVGARHCLALLASGELLAWGVNQEGQCNSLK